jgi:hypothetical protein
MSVALDRPQREKRRATRNERRLKSIWEKEYEDLVGRGSRKINRESQRRRSGKVRDEK